jgi:DNA-directed RNA polymerase subunit RPC12/RpoP
MARESRAAPAREANPIRCPVCDEGDLIPVDDIVTEIEGHRFVERGHRCSRCGEEFIPEEEGQRTIEAARRLGIWGNG